MGSQGGGKPNTVHKPNWRKLNNENGEELLAWSVTHPRELAGALPETTPIGDSIFLMPPPQHEQTVAVMHAAQAAAPEVPRHDGGSVTHATWRLPR